jgi:hypothetical protein
MAQCNPTSVPKPEGMKIGIEEKAEVVDAKKCSRLVGKLIYLLNTRIDTLFAVGIMSRYIHSPRIPHQQIRNQVLRYLHGIKDYEIFYQYGGDKTIHGYIDADWGNDLDDRTSLIGYVFKSVGGPITWCSKKQKNCLHIIYRSRDRSGCRRC